MEKDVPVGDIVVDMPISEALVRSKMKMLAEDGLVQPLTIWEQGMRVIDGFHRLEAAKRLGWSTIRCHLVDVSEEKFWSARIDSAKQHAEIEKPRLLAWIRECWKSSPVSGAEEMAETLWRLRKRMPSDICFYPGPLVYPKFHLASDDEEVLQWFNAKAERWQMTAFDVFDAVISEFGGTGARNPDADTINDIAIKRNLSIAEAGRLHSEIGPRPIGNRRRDAPELAVERFVDEGMPSGKFAQFVDAAKDDIHNQEVEAANKERREREAREQCRWDSEKGVLDMCEQVQDSLARRCEALETWISERADVVAATSAGKQIIAEHVKTLSEFSEKAWPHAIPSAQLIALVRLQSAAFQRRFQRLMLPMVAVNSGDFSWEKE